MCKYDRHLLYNNETTYTVNENNDNENVGVMDKNDLGDVADIDDLVDDFGDNLDNEIKIDDELEDLFENDQDYEVDIE
jgi:hypothetical protein